MLKKRMTVFKQL